VVGSLAIVLVTMVSLPWTAPPADASTSDLTIPLGDTSVQIAYVRTVDTVDRVYDTVNGVGYNSYPWEWAYSRACTRYTPGANNYWTDYVHGSSGQYAAVGYGRQVDEGPCPTYYQGEPGDVQTSLGFQPSNTTSVKAGNVFLVGRMRHVNSPIYSDDSAVTNPSQAKGTTYYGSFNINTAQTIQADFPWTEFDTINTCTGKLDSNGKLIIGDYGTDQQSVRTQYAYDRNGRVGRYDGSTYTYMYKNGSLAWFNGSMTQDFTDKNGRSCADDILDIKSDRSDTAWTDPNTGIKYKLKLWGFVNNGNNQQCRADMEKEEASQLEDRFVTRERAVSYGCLYGSIEQERPVTFAKDVKADSSVQGSLTIPTFNYVNASPEGTFGARTWGTPKSLTPTWNAEDVDPTDYTLLAPNDAASIRSDSVING